MPAGRTRRCFLQQVTASGLAGAAAVHVAERAAPARAYAAKNDRPLVAAVGVGGRGSADVKAAARFGDVVCVCDVDRKHAEKTQQALGGKAEVMTDYRKLLERRDIDVIINGTPDHWHTRINVDACRAGKDVYTEKPLALTIAEGKLLRKVVAETGRIVQVGTQQRSDANFRLACELVRNGRIGQLKQVTVTLPFWTTTGGPFAKQPVPAELDWDLWQGQAPQRDYCPQRVHFNYRWWADYAGGIITDWGQHHMDIAYWGMDMEKSGPLSVEASAMFPNAGRPDCYDNPDRFVAKLQFPGGIDLLFFVARDEKYRHELTATDEAKLFASVQTDMPEEKRNGIMFSGTDGRVFCNRGKVYGKAVEEYPSKPFGSDATRLYVSNDHMQNFFDCVVSRKPTISTVDVAHRVITACHLTNVAIRAGRKITWDAVKEEIVGDAEASRSPYVSRPQRKPYTLDG